MKTEAELSRQSQKKKSPRRAVVVMTLYITRFHERIHFFVVMSNLALIDLINLTVLQLQSRTEGKFSLFYDLFTIA